MIVGQDPVTTQCPGCHATVTSTVTRRATTKTHLFALLLCLFGCWPCVILPYCMDSCRQAEHSCPSCHQHIGVSVE